MRARVRVHDERGRALGPPRLADLGEHLLGLVLDRGVEREPDVRAVLGALDLVELERVAERVLDQAALAVVAAQVGVEPVLEAGEAGAVGADVAEQLGGHPRARVLAVVLRDELEALDPELARALGAAHRDLLGEVDEARVAPDELLEDVVLGLAQRVGELARGLAGAVDQVRRGGDRHRGVGDRELVAVGVGDRAAPGGDVDVVLLLRDRGGLERVRAHEAEPARAARREQQHAGGRRRRGARSGGRPALRDRDRRVGGRRAAVAAGSAGGRRPPRWRSRRSAPAPGSSRSVVVVVAGRRGVTARHRSPGAARRSEPGTIPSLASSAAASALGGCIALDRAGGVPGRAVR